MPRSAPPREPTHQERLPLLPNRTVTDTSTNAVCRTVPDEYVHRVLFLAFSASVAMAATAATTVFAYAVILCEEPAHCRDDEKGSYAGAVALAAGIANVCGILALGPLQHAVQLNAKYGLFFWLMSRATSVAILALAVWYKSIRAAILARVFEGLATDNLLHYALSAIYVSAKDQARFSRLMGFSLALFMFGMSTSPTIAGLLPGFFSSFIMALSVFAISLLYLGVLVPVIEVGKNPLQGTPAPDTYPRWKSGTSRLFQPFLEMYAETSVAMSGLALLLFNTTQAYLFPALMVYTSTKFYFTNTQNGYLISTAATVSALYLLMVHYVKPRLDTLWKRIRQADESPQMTADSSDDTGSTEGQANNSLENDRGQSSAQPCASTSISRTDFLRAILSLSVQIVAFPGIALATEVWQIYFLVSALALGLAAPSFMKSYAVSLAGDKSAAVASLAMMESLGGLLSTVVLGTLQSWTGSGGTVFYVASGIVGSSLFALVASHLARRMRTPGV